ncbi:hypothetical protein AA0498_1925 [Acidomonas methanolica]|uniref:Uncharacterized protein n=1 Tax=Acidomonas methanolica NBRC 104435 TaxID=1231351 RepID=A0A023D9Q7_ACIMT|nr:hypothetical protein Amme_136_013 [Acidomonas methanolica NBRC 104435]GBQ53357.1 hypothetical protein AA0498_1925 [Acidomonas methanolica]GEK98438.1 UPF0262 protein [Acidomonas methanolica NBRC 104435]
MLDVVLDAMSGDMPVLEERRRDRQQAVRDLISTGSFQPGGLDGPFILHLARQAGKLVFDVRDAEDAPRLRLPISLAPLRRLIKDYNLTVESYAEAIAEGNPIRIRAMDFGRRALHDEAAAELRAMLEGQVAMDFDTARRLFSLICVMAARD